MKHIRKLANRKNNKSVERVVTQSSQPTKKVIDTKMIIVQQPKEQKKKQPLINIITRTSGRPNGFKRCHQSILNQSYPNIRHIVSIDRLEDAEYVKQYDVDYYFIDKEKIVAQPDIPDPKTGKRFIYNLYFNELFDKVEEGWIMILDDDDYLSHKNAIRKIVNKIESNTDMVIFQMVYPNGSVLPTIQEMGVKPRLARIGSPCILTHSGIAKTIRWDGWKCGDYRYISKVWDKTGEKKWVKQPIVLLGSGGGFGLRKDISSNEVLIKTENTLEHKQTKEMGKDNSVALKQFKKKFNVKETTNNDVENFSRGEIYTIDYTFNYLYDKLQKGENFSFVRFGDNDFMHIFEKYKGKALGHNKTVFNKRLKQTLTESLSIDEEPFIKTYNYGGRSIYNPKLGSRAHSAYDAEILKLIKNKGDKPPYHSVLFFYLMVGFYHEYTQKFFKPIKESEEVLLISGIDKKHTQPFLGDVKTQIKTQKTNSTANIDSYLKKVDKVLSKSNHKYIILACGQLSRVIAGHIYNKYGNEYTMLDIGGIIESYYPQSTKNAVRKWGRQYRKNLNIK